MNRGADNPNSDQSPLGAWFGSWRRFISLLLISFSICGLGFAGNGLADPMLSLKAAFCYRFLFYIDWPKEPRVEVSDDVELCVVRSERVGEAFEAAFADVVGEDIKGRRFTVESIDAEAEIEAFESCSMIFISDDRPEKVEVLLERVADFGVVTVGDTPGFIDLGGMIGLTVVEESIEYDVNLRAVKHADIKMRSRLLKSAQRVER